VDPKVSESLFNEEVEQLRTQARFGKGGWAIVSATFPDLLIQIPHPRGSRLFRFRCDDWDDLPPSVKSVDTSGNVLEGEPTGHLFMGLKDGWGLCAPGTREYHNHHTENPWENHREELTLGRIVLRVGSHYRSAEP
jgi:hypothetical protein